MTQCQQCHAELFVEGIPQGQQVRCVSCSHLFRLGEAEKVSADRWAWRSFWLGLSSLILLFITGIPAIYYGVRSLLRMRFSRPGPGDRMAAIAGTIMGSVFGLFGGMIVIGFGVILAATFLTMDVRKNPAQIVELFGTIFEQPPPAKLTPTRGAKILNAQYFFDFVDSTSPKQRTIRVHLVHYRPNLQQPTGQIIAHLRGRTLSSDIKLEETDSRILNWKMGGQDIEVRKTVFDIVADAAVEASPDGSTTLPNNEVSQSVSGTTDAASPKPVIAETSQVAQYFGFYKNAAGVTGMCVSIRYPNSNIPETQVQEMFANVKHRAP